MTKSSTKKTASTRKRKATLSSIQDKHNVPTVIVPVTTQPVLTWQQKNRQLVMEQVHQDLLFMIDGFVTSPRGDFRWLSNYEVSPIVFENWIVPTAEHLYHMLKTSSKEEREDIMSDPNPIMAKRKGQKVTLRLGWDSIKNDVMEYVLRLKFAKGSKLAEKLKVTYPRDLVETNWWHDNFFGTCLCSTCNDKGLNNLGILLMKIREDLVSMPELPSEVL